MNGQLEAVCKQRLQHQPKLPMPGFLWSVFGITIDNANKTASLDITDDDTALVSIAKSNDGAEPGTNGKFQVTQSKASSTDTVVSYMIAGTAVYPKAALQPVMAQPVT